MSANRFKLNDKVEGNFTVERTSTFFRGIDEKDLKWNNHEGHEYLSLDEILNQVIEKENAPMPFIRVHYESGLWGVIFEIGNYSELGKQWIVHGITKGYA